MRLKLRSSTFILGSLKFKGLYLFKIYRSALCISIQLRFREEIVIRTKVRIIMSVPNKQKTTCFVLKDSELSSNPECRNCWKQT